MFEWYPNPPATWPGLVSSALIPVDRLCTGLLCDIGDRTFDRRHWRDTKNGWFHGIAVGTYIAYNLSIPRLDLYWFGADASAKAHGYTAVKAVSYRDFESLDAWAAATLMAALQYASPVTPLSPAGLPWEIHAIADPVALREAHRAWSAAHV